MCWGGKEPQKAFKLCGIDLQVSLLSVELVTRGSPNARQQAVNASGVVSGVWVPVGAMQKAV